MRHNMAAIFVSDEAIVLWTQAQPFSVEELAFPACSNLAFSMEGLQGQSVLLCLSLQVWQQLLVPREGLVLHPVRQAQASVQGMKLEGPFLEAQPLPTCMDALRIQHMVRGQEESRSQTSTEALVLSLAMPQ